MVIVQNRKPEKDGRDARAVNIMERGPDLVSLWPCHLQVCDGLRHVSPCPWDPPIKWTLGGRKDSLSQWV